MKRSFYLLRLSSRYLFHIIVWLVYGTYILMSMEGYIRKKGWLFSLPPIAISVALVAVLVYVNAMILIPKLLEKKKIVLYIIAVLILAIVNTYLRSLASQYYDGLVWPDDIMALGSYYKWNFFNSFWSLLISTLLWYSLKWSKQKEQVKNIQVAQLQTELRYLRSQLNPHFLFNGLNTIYGNIERSNQQARDILLQFSDLMRYNIYEADVDWIGLGREAEFLENYVDFQKARSSPNLEIVFTKNIVDGSVKVAPLIFIVFVENSFKFISHFEQEKNYVHISLVQKDKTIEFRCQNSFEENDTIKGGIGLLNAQRRLELLYGEKYKLSIDKSRHIYTVNLILES